MVFCGFSMGLIRFVYGFCGTLGFCMVLSYSCRGLYGYIVHCTLKGFPCCFWGYFGFFLTFLFWGFLGWGSSSDGVWMSRDDMYFYIYCIVQTVDESLKKT